MLIADLTPHPENPNRMEPEMFAKLVANIRRTGLMPAVIVRDLGTGQFQILDGHHRVKAAKKLGWDKVPVENWGQVSDGEARLLLATLNRLRGRDEKKLRTALLTQLRATYEQAPSTLSEYVPESPTQIVAATETTVPSVDPQHDDALAAEVSPFTVLLNVMQEGVIRSALTLARSKKPRDPSMPTHATHGGIAEDLRLGDCLFEICSDYLLRYTRPE